MAGRNQFVVPQFLDIEPKILGPITVRQFLIMLATVLLEFIIYRFFVNTLWGMLGLGLPVLIVGVSFAFVKVNGQSFHYIVLNMIQTSRKPKLRTWDKTLTDADIKLLMVTVEPPAPPAPKKAGLTSSRLSELTLIVDTGGVYQGDERA